jgi:hypothetical protein
MNPPDTHYHVNLNTLNPTTSTNPTSPQLMNTSIPRIPTETPRNCTNLIGYILIDMFSDFMVTLRKVLSKATSKTKETVRSKFFFTWKITQFK